MPFEFQIDNCLNDNFASNTVVVLTCTRILSFRNILDICAIYVAIYKSKAGRGRILVLVF